ncbi:tetratricopeptide repeat protein [Ichthyophthirius multifiliis]|uniref:Tetratricopeptide repeat protein n=1 Tax=Ichthyophthirius multifiliis TaxID=5932 RepID=G0QVW6_ICHMU|nr:tetratricopeptide repeat protein [Ichthyophthirius multifiliis]EGR30631.1 tetratricopeptide repeat protein [Ichthyophthirius multifiliis]|eukprot:XP_004032218.1 tetratricopeptide repeat protein [Ichthyophthirius multifiliis]
MTLLGLQTITILENLHKKNIIHRDIKPENFVIGPNCDYDKIFLVDFGLAKFYSNNNIHISLKKNKGMIGTARYASINAHLGLEQSRRDDLESLGYCLVYFLNNKLPWQSVYGQSKEEKYQKIQNIKQQFSNYKYFKELPQEFLIFMKYIKELQFDENPNYDFLRPGSSISKAKINKQSSGVAVRKVENKIPQLDEYIKKRDWVGSIVHLENERRLTDTKEETQLWHAYCCFHNGDYKKAIQIYDDMTKKPEYNKVLHVYKACCHYALCNYDEAKREAQKGTECDLQNRLMFHIAHKKSDEKNLMAYHHKLNDTTQDQLCLAAIHFLRSHHEEAVDIYKKLLLENKEYLAINVYIALCYYKLDYYDVSLEILSAYINQNPSSIIAANLKAVNQYQLFSGKIAEDSFKPLQQAYEGSNIFEDNDLLRHNLVVFRGGENALQVFPPLIDVFPEARLNLVIYHLKNGSYQEAFTLVKDLEPSVPREYIIKGVVYAVLGQENDQKEHLKAAQQLFQLVGSSASECDTIPGRQCMASCFFLLKQFEDVLVYLKSIRNFFQNDDDFNWNYAIACSGNGQYKDSEEAFTLIQNEKYRNDDTYIRWLTRTYIMNGKPKLAWELYINMETSSESFQLLLLIANDCYKMGHFYYAAKAFDILERLDSERDYEDALRGAVVGVFQMVIAQKDSSDHLVEVLNMLKSGGNNPQVEYIFKVVRKWGQEHGVQI